MIGSLLGAQSVVLYSCTSKLTSVLANHPQLVMASATPALSELWAAGRRERLVELVTALTLAMLCLSGLIVCLTLALNEGFRHLVGGPTAVWRRRPDDIACGAAGVAALEHRAHLRPGGLRPRTACVDHESGGRRRVGRPRPAAHPGDRTCRVRLWARLSPLSPRACRPTCSRWPPGPRSRPHSWVRGLLPCGWRIVALGHAQRLAADGCGCPRPLAA